MHSDRCTIQARAALAAALLLGACLDPIPPNTLTSPKPPGAGTLIGSVRDYCAGTPLVRAEVSARRVGAPANEAPRAVDTGDAGQFTFEGLTAGRWNVRASMRDYQVSEWPFEVAGDRVLSADLTLTRVPSTLPTSAVTLDVLFVVDNSNSMEAKQATLASAFPSFMDAILASHVALDLHVGVVSTDMGAGSYSLPSCEAGGDDGKLQSKPRAGGCTGPGDAFISATTASASGSPVVVKSNVAGQGVTALNDAFSCIARLGTSGCGLEQPLAALRKAVAGGANPGFLRADAALAIIVLSDEDDCSAQDTHLFDPSPGAQDLFGPLTSYRCFQFGVTCDKDGRVPGARQGCTPTKGGYLLDVDTVAAELQTLRPRGKLHLAVIAGPPEPVEVGQEGVNLVLRPSCQFAGGSAVPATRMWHLVERLRPDSSFDSICASDLRDNLASIATRIVNTTLLNPCK